MLYTKIRNGLCVTHLLKKLFALTFSHAGEHLPQVKPVSSVKIFGRKREPALLSQMFAFTPVYLQSKISPTPNGWRYGPSYHHGGVRKMVWFRLLSFPHTCWSSQHTRNSFLGRHSNKQYWAELVNNAYAMVFKRKFDGYGHGLWRSVLNVCRPHSGAKVSESEPTSNLVPIKIFNPVSSLDRVPILLLLGRIGFGIVWQISKSLFFRVEISLSGERHLGDEETCLIWKVSYTFPPRRPYWEGTAYVVCTSTE